MLRERKGEHMLTRNSLFISRGIVVSQANSTKGNVIDGQHFKLHKGKKHFSH
jgi:hypothetical protein